MYVCVLDTHLDCLGHLCNAKLLFFAKYHGNEPRLLLTQASIMKGMYTFLNASWKNQRDLQQLTKLQIVKIMT